LSRSEPHKRAKKTSSGATDRPSRKTGGQNRPERASNRPERASNSLAKGAAKGPGRGPAKGAPKGKYSGKSGGKSPSRSAGPGRKKPEDDRVRLNKYIAASGICSRREADHLISAGLVSVNGKTITELGTKVDIEDDVRYNGERLRNERKVYLLLNKPKDYVTTTDDPKERKTVMQLIRNAGKERVYPVGRLDRNTTGVLLFTNDGEMAKKLTHPSYNKKKIYHIFLEKAFTAADMKKLSEGITLEDGFIQPDAISYVSSEHKREIGLEIHSGRNRIVRRMFESLGYRVSKLDRVYFAGLTKKNVPKGKWRFLAEKEINRLKMNAYE
jgi:23S rRNA pseudouridine2605 synthase